MFWPNSIQHDDDCAGTCLTKHMRNQGVFNFRTKAPGIMGLAWLDIVVASVASVAGCLLLVACAVDATDSIFF
jgi:hypothetical protein